MATSPGWLTVRVAEPGALPLEVPKGRVPTVYMLLRIFMTGILMIIAAIGAYTTTIDKSAGDATIGLIFFTLALLYVYGSSPEAHDLQLDAAGFTYRQFVENTRVGWEDVTSVRPGAVFRDFLGLVLVSCKSQPKPMPISGYFDVTREDLAAAMTALSKASTDKQTA